MAFQFRLKVLSQHREYLHKRAQMVLAAAIRHYEDIESQQSKVKGEIHQQTLLWEEKQSSGIHVTDYLSFRDYVQSLERHLLQLDIELGKARREVDKTRKLLLDKEKDAKILESLKEQEREAYYRLESQREQKQMDEVAIFRDYYKKITT